MTPLTSMSSDLCASTQSRFSNYLDGEMSGQEMAQIASHLNDCPGCARSFAEMRLVQESLAALGPVRPPEDLGMKLRLAISHERARSSFTWKDRLAVRWENAVRPLLLQVSAGLAGTVALVGGIALLLGMFAAPEPVMANDVPLGAMTAPHYLYSAAEPRPIVTDRDATIVVEANINDRGQVYDYRIVEGPNDPLVRNQIVDQLLESVFTPARVFGVAVRGRVVLTFAGISVRG